MKPYNILYHAINGSGFGHVKRAQNILSFVKNIEPIGEIHLATSCTQKLQISQEFQIHPLSLSIGESEYSDYSQKTSFELTNIVDTYGIDAFFHDTYFIVDFLLQRRDIYHFLVYRLTSREHFLEIEQYFGYFKKIFIPHTQEEFYDIIGKDVGDEYKNLFVFTGYIFPQEKIKFSLLQNTLLISPGLGGDYEQTKDFLGYIIELCKNLDGFSQKILYPGKYRKQLELELDFLDFTQIHDFSPEYQQDFQKAGIFIGRGGYNSVGESIFHQKKSLLFSAQRKDESQEKRIDFFSGKYNFLKKGSYNFSLDRERLQAFLHQGDLNLQGEGIENGGYVLQETLQSIFSQPSVMIFYPSYFQKSHIFVRDELSELSNYIDIHIYTFNRDFRESRFSKNNYRIFYTSQFDGLYDPNIYPYFHNYSDSQKKLFAAWFLYMRSQISLYKYSVCMTEFLGDGVYISLLKKYFPNIRFFSLCRGNDLYVQFQKFSIGVQETFFKNFEKIFVMDSAMRNKILSEGCPEKKVEIFYVGKCIKDYIFSHKDSQNYSIVLGGRFVPKKGILESLDILEGLLVSGNVSISHIYLLGEGELRYREYGKQIESKINNSSLLSQNIIQLGFVTQEVYMELIHKKTNIFIGHFCKAEDGDEDGIPNVLLENMLVGNLVFSSLSGGIADILSDGKTGYILSGKPEEDIVKIETVLGKKQYQEVLENARRFVSENFEQGKQASILIRNIIEPES